MKIFYILTFLLSLNATGIDFQEAGKLAPKKYVYLIYNALNKAGENEAELIKAINEAAPSQKEAVIFLISFMPERDLRDLNAKFILENTRLAFAARQKFPWAQKVPVNVFLNDVLPYAVLNERRDNWRKDFMERFSKVVKDCKTLEEAVIAVNKNIKENTGVSYSTKRPKADQSPYESMNCKLASCTGLSILLADALRSIGIPCRIAGVPEWTAKRGNHNWNEVWVNGEWKFTEFYFAGLNKGWFLKDAAAVNEKKWNKKIYATSYSPTQYWFPCVWDFNIRYIHGIDVTARYKAIYKQRLIDKQKGQRVAVIVLQKLSGPRISKQVVIKDKNGKVVAKGLSKGPQDDLNNFLEFSLPMGKYTIEFNGQTKPLIVKQKPLNRFDFALE